MKIWNGYQGYAGGQGSEVKLNINGKAIAAAAAARRTSLEKENKSG